ncbi:alpha/beta fold hydrolase [Aquamicrobium zhengzhouense]|nr:alpha/beta hydrolase [Aquamicrobium zhengzhouense]
MSFSENIPTSKQLFQDTGCDWTRRDLFRASALMGLGLALSPTLGQAAPSSTAIPVRRQMVQAIDGPFHVLEQGEGPAVLFCHGFPDTAETWRSQMQAVAEAGYRAVALDMRGYGRSFAPENPDLYTALHITGDLIAVLDALSIDNAVIVGHDWGAYNAQHAALMRPDRFRALVSISIPFAPRGEVDPWQILRDYGLNEAYYAFELAEPGAETLFADAQQSIPSILYWLSASPAPALRWNPLDPHLHMLRPAPVAVPEWADPDYVNHTISAFQRTGFRGGLNYYTAFSRTFELTAAFKGAVIQQPALYIWGAADGLSQMLHPETPSLETLREAQPNLVDQIRLENVGHWVQNEAADRVNNALTSFLLEI